MGTKSRLEVVFHWGYLPYQGASAVNYYQINDEACPPDAGKNQGRKTYQVNAVVAGDYTEQTRYSEWYCVDSYCVPVNPKYWGGATWSCFDTCFDAQYFWIYYCNSPLDPTGYCRYEYCGFWGGCASPAYHYRPPKGGSEGKKKGPAEEEEEKPRPQPPEEETYDECMKRMMGELYDKRISEALIDCVRTGEEFGLELAQLLECARLARGNWVAFVECVKRTLGDEVLSCILGIGVVTGAFLQAWAVAHEACSGRRGDPVGN